MPKTIENHEKHIPRKHSKLFFICMKKQRFCHILKIIMKTQLREAPNFMAPIFPKTPPTQGPWFLTSFHQKTLENTAIQLLQWLRDAISFSFRVNQLHTPLSECCLSTWAEKRYSVRSTETLPAVQKFFPQYRILPTVQKLFPQCRNSSRSTEVFPRYRNYSCSA